MEAALRIATAERKHLPPSYSPRTPLRLNSLYPESHFFIPSLHSQHTPISSTPFLVPTTFPFPTIPVSSLFPLPKSAELIGGLNQNLILRGSACSGPRHLILERCRFSLRQR